MGRRTGEETRALLLRVGMQMLLERGVSAGVQHIRLQDVLRRAELTTGAAYRLWADQTDYQRDLAVAMVRLRVTAPAGYVAEAVTGLIAAGADGDDVIRAAAEAHVNASEISAGDPDASLDSQSFLISLALRTTADTWPELKAASRERHDDSVAAFAELYGFLMDSYGLRMKTPLTVTDFAEAMAALGEGFAIRGMEGLPHPQIHSAESDEVPTGPWTLFALGVRALVNEFMVPVER